MSIIISETRDGFTMNDYGWGNGPDGKLQSHIKEDAPSKSDHNSSPKCPHCGKNIWAIFSCDKCAKIINTTEELYVDYFGTHQCDFCGSEVDCSKENYHVFDDSVKDNLKIPSLKEIKESYCKYWACQGKLVNESAYNAIRYCYDYILENITNEKSNKTKEIISDNELDAVWGKANFGSMTKRDVIKYGLLKCASGYYQGHTSKTILEELGLINSQYEITANGKMYLWEAFNQSDL